MAVDIAWMADAPFFVAVLDYRNNNNQLLWWEDLDLAVGSGKLKGGGGRVFQGGGGKEGRAIERVRLRGLFPCHDR